MAVGIPTGFVRKLYRILDHESAAIIGWDPDGTSFSIHDSAQLNAQVLPRYFRGRLCAFRQQLVDHGFRQAECEEHETREVYAHPDFLRGCPGRLSNIERRPQPKKKPAASNTNTNTNTTASNGLLPVRLSLSAQQSRPTSLTVTLHATPGKRRSGADLSAAPTAKRQRVQQQPAPVPALAPPTSSNPLFSNEPDTGSLSLARLVEGSGLLPRSTDIPDPIDYLGKAANGQTQQSRLAAPAMFSDDMVKSALFFLVSTSTTGQETATAATATAIPPTTAPTPVPVPAPAPATLTQSTASTSGFLAALLASSTTGNAPTSTNGSGNGSATENNPLFSDQSADGEDSQEDSIWNLLVASSVDRVRGAINDVTSPQEKLQLILAEREKLEEQRKKVGAPVGPVGLTLSTLGSIISQPNQQPQPQPQLQSKSQSPPQIQSNPLFATGSSAAANQAAEDDLWRLLMSSSIDSFRRAADLGM